MYEPLVPCPACERHVRASEARCPFCEGALPTDLARRAIPGTSARLGRAALAVFATGLVGVACSGAPAPADPNNPGTGGPSSGGQGNDNGAVVAMYGAPVEPTQDAGATTPPPDDAAGAPITTPTPDPGAPAPAYGGAPPRGPRPGAGRNPPNDNGMMHTLYGVAPKPDDD